MKKITLLISAFLFFLCLHAQCTEPSKVHLFNDYYRGFCIIWDGNGEDNWDIEYGEMGFSPTGIPTNENLAYPFFDFYVFDEPAIYIDFYVRADCDPATSDWVGPFTFFNHCFQDVNDAPAVFEDFEEDFLPLCWTQSNEGTPDTGVGIFGDSSWEASDFANNSSNSIGAKINISGTGVNDWLVLPALLGYIGRNDRDNGDLILNFDIALTQANTTSPAIFGSDDVIELVISPDLGDTWFTIQNWNVNSSISSSGELISLIYQNFTHGFNLNEKVFLVAFWASSGTVADAENVDFFIDNVHAVPPWSGSVDDLVSKGFSYFPNPSNNSINLSAKETINQVTLYNSLGQKVKQVDIDKLNYQMDISDLHEVVYYMHIRIGNTIGVVPIIKN